MTDRTLRADLMAFLAAGARGGRRVILRTPDYHSMCGRPNRLTGVRCGADCVLGQSYCFDCRQEYQENRGNLHSAASVFHDDTKQILRAYRYMRRLANRAEAA